MSALALLGGLSGGQGGQKFGGDAGPSQSGASRSGFSGGVGGLNFSPQSGNQPAWVMPATIAVIGVIGYLAVRR